MDAANGIKRNNSLLNQKKVARAGTWPVGRQSEVPCLTGATGHRSWWAPSYPRPPTSDLLAPVRHRSGPASSHLLGPRRPHFYFIFSVFFSFAAGRSPTGNQQIRLVFSLIHRRWRWLPRALIFQIHVIRIQSKCDYFFLNYRWQHLAEFLHPPKCF